MTVRKLASVDTTSTSSPSGCHATAVGPSSTRVSATTSWKRELVGSMSMKLTVALAKLVTARRVMFGDVAMLTGSDSWIVSSTVNRLLLTTTT